MKRHADALVISDGACNPSGIALAIAESCKEIREHGGDMRSDPAIRLMVHQLAFLVGVPTNEGLTDWESWRTACRQEQEVAR